MTTRIRVLLSAATLLVYAWCAAPLLRGPALCDHEARHAETTLTLLDRGADPGVDYWRPAMPWMRDSYSGSLKVYLLYLPLKLLGPGIGALRLAGLAAGALAAVLMSLLVGRLYGRGAAAAAGAFFATDPALVLYAAFDTGPQILALALKMAALSCLAAWRERPSRRWLPFAAGLLLGLAWWDKAHFVWFVAALAAALLIFVPLSVVRARAGAAGLAAAGFLAGCSPLLIYNVLCPAHTLTESGHLGDFTQHWSRFGPLLAQSLDSLGSALGGHAAWSHAAAALDPSFVAARRAIAGLLTVLALAMSARRGLLGLRHAAFWLALSALTLLAAVLSPLPVKAHHLFLIYPFPHLALASLLGRVWDRPSPRAPRWTAALAVALLAVWQGGLVSMRFPREYARTGGDDQHDAAIVAAVAGLREHHRLRPDARILAHSKYLLRLRFYTAGRIALRAYEESAQPSVRVARLWECAGGLAVLPLTPEGTLEDPVGADLRLAGIDAERLSVVERRPGEPWLAFFALRPRFERDGGDRMERLAFARAFARGRPEILARLALSRGSGAFWTEAAELELGAGDAGAARRALERAEGVVAPRADRRRLAALWAAAGRPARARAALRGLELEFARDPGYWLERARAEWELGERPAAKQALERARSSAAAPEHWRRVSELSQSLGDCGRSVEILTRLLEASRDPALYADRGLCQELLGRRREAVEDLRRALEIRPAFLPAALTLGTVYARDGLWAEELSVYEKAFEASAGRADPLRPRLSDALGQARRRAQRASGRSGSRATASR